MAEAVDGSKPAEASRRRHLSRSSSPSPGRSNKRTAQADETKRVRRGEKDQKEQDNSTRMEDKSEQERRSNRDRDRERDQSRNRDRDRDRDRDRHQRSSSRRERDRSRSDKDSRRDRDRDRNDSSCRREHRHREHGEQKKDKDAGSREGHHPERQNPTSEQTSDRLSLDEHKAVQPNETVPTSEACPPPPPPSTASFAAPKPAQAGALTAEAKKQLLWSGKRASTDQNRGPPAGTSNHWEAVHFADRERQEKFNKLMGVKSKQAMDQEQPGQVDKHREMQEDLEKQFTAGLRRRDGRTVGLGL